MESYRQFEGFWRERAQLAWDTLALKPARGIPTWVAHVMDVEFMEELTGHPPGSYVKDPDQVYLAFQDLAGSCFIDQYIPTNPLTMGLHGFEVATVRGATTGADKTVLDGVEIDSPEAVVRHMEEIVFPRRAEEIRAFNPDDPARLEPLLAGECAVQKRFGPNLLKGPYGDGFQSFPGFGYGRYGYVNYFSAYALYPEVIQRDFAQQGELSALGNRVAARAILAGGLPKMLRLDHDMADSRGTLVDVRSLDRIWFPHFRRAIRPLLDAGIRLIWHCDGNLMAMVPRLLEAGVGGFQGFQYEDGMDYPRICRMKTRDGGPLLIFGGVSVTRTLPFGTRADVAAQLKWLVDNGPPAGLFLGPSSSIAPGTNHDNIRAFLEGLNHYRLKGRS